MRKVLVSGSGGFLGGHVVEYFLNQSLQVIALFHKELAENNFQTEKRNIQKSELLSRIPQNTQENLTILDGDITNGNDMEALFHDNQPDAMVHAAAILIAPKESDELACKRFYEVNEGRVLADLIAEYQRIKNNFYCMLISTIFAFDLTAEEINEETLHKPNANNLYAKSKEAAEQYWKSKILNLAVLYPPQIYGPYQFTPAIMPKILRKLLFDSGVILDLNGAINPIHIKNIVKLIYALCISAEAGCFCVNGDGAMSLQDIGRSLLKLSINFLMTHGKTPFIAFNPFVESASSKVLKINDSRLLQFFNSKFLAENPHESISFEDTAREMVVAMSAHAEVKL